MRKIAIFTGTRAEYGLLYWTMKALQHDPEFELKIIVSGAHLSPTFGETWRQIEADNFTIDEKVEMLLSSDTPVGVLKSMGLATIGLSETLDRLKPDALFILGDRYETLVAAQVALILNIPILHAHGGELTLGAYDDAIRHAITKMASLHFVSTECYRKRVIQMGESPCTVYNVGAFGLEHLLKIKYMSFVELQETLKVPLRKKYFVVTYHPETKEKLSSKEGLINLCKVLDEFSEYDVFFTYPNADNGGIEIIQIIEDYIKMNSNRAFATKTLGSLLYLNLLKYTSGVIGNSSSAIIEAPSLHIPTVNIGDRQTGRLAAESIITTDTSYEAIAEAVNRITQEDFQIFCKSVTNPYGDGTVSDRVLMAIKQHQFKSTKAFKDWDINYEI